MAGVSRAQAAPERVIVPYSCAKAGARLTVTPSAPHRFNVIGPHEVRRASACWMSGRRAGTAGCALVEVHRFNLSCGGKRVAWADVAAAIMRRGPQSFTRGRVGTTTGFAAVEGTGAQLVAPGRPPAGAARSGILNAVVTSQPLPDITPAAAPGGVGHAPGDATMSLLTDVAHRTLGGGAHLPAVDLASPPSQAPQALMGWMLLLSVGGMGAAAWRWPGAARHLKALAARAALAAIEGSERAWQQLETRVGRGLGLLFAGPGERPRARPLLELKASNAAGAVASMLTETERRISSLKGAGPLGEVLKQECGQLRQRLAGLAAAASEGEEAAERASPGFRNLMRDIERVRRIADSAALSLGARGPARVPKTRAEAFDLLGLNPEAPEGTLKKVADGLRMSWHPDHARDAADRAEREARVKAINVAIELIKGERVVA